MDTAGLREKLGLQPVTKVAPVQTTQPVKLKGLKWAELRKLCSKHSIDWVDGWTKREARKALRKVMVRTAENGY
jgi:hypothetical protein